MLKHKFIKTLCVLSLICISNVFAEDSPEVTAITNFDVSKYLGTWYEIARIPFSFENDCIAPITANYTINPNDSSQLIITNQCSRLNQTPKVDIGLASFAESATTGKLNVTFLPQWIRWIPFTHGDYWIIYTDYTDYAIVGSPNHKYLWVLARSENFNQEKLNKLLLTVEVQGFDINQLIYNYKKSSQTNAVESTN